MTTTAVILAAGKGTRMRSELPKVLHPLAGRPMLAHVIATARAVATGAPVVVYGHGGQILIETIADPDLTFVEQAEQLGTGHAVMQALPRLESATRVLVLYGDVPLLTPATLERLLSETPADAVGVLTARVADPTGYGRIVRDDAGLLTRIVEHKDAIESERAIDEINTGIMVLPSAPLATWLAALGNDNAQGEYYLTDLIAMARSEGVSVTGVVAGSEIEVSGVNDRVQLAVLERAFQRRVADALMRAGATLADPARIDVRGELTVGRDVAIDVGCVFEGRVELGDRVRVGPYAILRDVSVASGSVILEHSSVTEAEIGAGARIGPFARIRPGTVLAAGTHIGNFVEVKKAHVGEGSKVNHLSYVGDARIGRDVNVGAGTITCNYDGAHKHETVIEDDVFVGSDTQLVAPVTVGRGATIGAGTTVTRDVPPETLAISRTKQTTIDGWTRPRKKS